MVKRKTLAIQRAVFKAIKEDPGITMSSLERKIGTNPASLKDHCEALSYFNLIKIKRTSKTTMLHPI